jgi:hypothetical protein
MWTTRDFVGEMPTRLRQSFYFNATRVYTYNFTQGGVMQYKSPDQSNSS